MEQSIFTDKSIVPNAELLTNVLGETINYWNELTNYVYKLYPNATEEWSYPGIKYGWSFRIKDKKRVIIYFLPRDNYFKVAFNFSQKAFESILNSSVSDSIKIELEQARVYMEGRGIRISVRNSYELGDIKTLIEIKISN